VNEAVSTAESSRSPDNDNKRLLITISPTTVPPTSDHALLVAFRFSSEASHDPRDEIIDPGPELISGDDSYECWWYRGNIQRRSMGDIRIAECEDYAFVTLQREDVPPGRFRNHAFAAYTDLLEAVNATGYGHLVRIWNYFPDINVGEGDDEKYRQFSIGRAEAFEEAGIFDDSMPAATAVGSSDGSFSIIALVSKHDFFPTENPRQVSAYKYPRQYGPRSPKFSRGGCVATQDHHLVLMSGTAAIIGHESMHPYMTELQTEETLKNLSFLDNAISGRLGDTHDSILDAQNLLRVYLRDREDLASVAERLRKQFGSIDANVMFLRADICRRELMIEIDGVRCF
jgi:chorismate lyase/3-hydroxybenzoate synthase